MSTIQFNAQVGDDQVIRPPKGVILPLGAIEVQIRPVSGSTADRVDPAAGTRDWLLALAEEAEQAAPELPPDLAEYHDHYAHGKPRP